MVFTGTATLSAFILPVHIALLLRGDRIRLDATWMKVYFFILVFAALYHGFYRVRTIAFDLTWIRVSNILGAILPVLLAGFMTLTVFLLAR